jgi:hypothetical protein
MPLFVTPSIVIRPPLLLENVPLFKIPLPLVLPSLTILTMPLLLKVATFSIP